MSQRESCFLGEWKALVFSSRFFFISSSFPTWVMRPQGPRQLLEVFMVPVGVGKLVAPYVIRCAIRGARGMQGCVRVFREEWGAPWAHRERQHCPFIWVLQVERLAVQPRTDSSLVLWAWRGRGCARWAGAMLLHGVLSAGTLGFGGSLSLVLLSGWTVSPGDRGWVEVGSCPCSEAGGAPQASAHFAFAQIPSCSMSVPQMLFS